MNAGMWIALAAIVVGIAVWWFTQDTPADHDGNEAESEQANAVGFFALLAWIVLCIATFIISGIVHVV